MIQNPVRLAVIGAGYWGRKAVEEYLNLEKADPLFHLAKVCDLKEENLTYCRNVLGINLDRLSTDYKDVLESSDIDAIHICTPNETHHEIGLQGLKQDKNVLLEKPIALTHEDAWTLCKIAESKHLCLQVGHIYRFNNAIKRIRELIAEGYFGDLYYLKLQWTTWMKSPLGRDIIFDLGPHPIDIMHYLLKKWPTKVTCIANSYRRPSLEEVAIFHLDFGNKLMANIDLSWLQPGKVRELTIIGNQRSARIDCLDQTIRIFEDNNGGNFSIDLSANNTIFDELSHFVRSIRDHNNHNNPGRIGAINVTILEKLKESLMLEKSIEVGLD